MAEQEELLVTAERFARDMVRSWPSDSEFGQKFQAAESDEAVRLELLDQAHQLPSGESITCVENNYKTVHLVLAAASRAQALGLTVPEFKLSAVKRVLANSASDTNVQSQLVSDPKRTLTDAGIEVPDGVEIEIHQNTDDQLCVVLPALESAEQTELKRKVTESDSGEIPADIEIEWLGPDSLSVGGTVDSQTAATLRQFLDKVNYDTDLDLKGVKFFSSQGIGILVRTQKRLANSGCRLRLINVPEMLMKVFKIFRLLDVLEIENREDCDLMQLFLPG